MAERICTVRGGVPAERLIQSGTPLSTFATFRPKVIEHDNVPDLIVPIDDHSAPFVGPTRPEDDVKG